MVLDAWTSGMIETQAGQGQVLLLEGDLTTLRTDAVVYYAREDLVLSSGYGTAIQSRGGTPSEKSWRFSFGAQAFYDMTGTSVEPTRDQGIVPT